MPYVDERLATIALRRVDTAVTTLAGQTGAARAASVRTAIEELLSIRRVFLDALFVARVLCRRCRRRWLLPSARSRRRSSGAVAADVGLRGHAARGGRPARSWPPPAATGRRPSSAAGSPSSAPALLPRRPRTTCRTCSPTTRTTRVRPRPCPVLIAANVAQATTDPIPAPAPLGTLGDRTVTFYNVTSTPLHLQITGSDRGGGRHGAGVPVVPEIPAEARHLPEPRRQAHAGRAAGRWALPRAAAAPPAAAA